MNQYYEILGLKPGASQAEIKKAYFTMIRQYSPESDPEQFQQIRHAYEQLKDMGNAPQGPEFPPIQDSFAQKMLQQIEIYRSSGDMELYRDACEEAWKKFPEYIQFLYLLITAQRRCGNTGKAVKNAELLVSKDPENQWFQRELAISYIERGFTKKAWKACEKTYALGCRELDFIQMYALECNTYNQYDRGVQLLLEVIQQEKRWTKEELPELMNAYIGLLAMNHQAEKSRFSEIAEPWAQTLKQYSIYITEYIPEFCMVLHFTCNDKRLSDKEHLQLEQILDLLQKASREDPEIHSIIEETRMTLRYRRLQNNPLIGDTLLHGYEVYSGLQDDLEPFLLRYAQIDLQLCMIEERAEILEQAEIIRNEYPDYYEKLQDFLEKLKSEKNLFLLKNELQKEYHRMSATCNGGYYYEKYPEEKKKLEGTLIHDSSDFEPYVRTSRKIGRNDPCPCGSGKKYKHCCMRKN